MKKVILDYGGVICKESRVSKIANTLGLFTSEKSLFESYMKSEMIKSCAIGRVEINEVYVELHKILPRLEISDFKSAFYEASRPKDFVIDFLKMFAKSHKLFLVSNSLPPFSDYIENNLQFLFEKTYLSDREGFRKPDDMYIHILSLDQDFFNTAILVDDQELNLMVPRELGADTFLFSKKDCLPQFLVSKV